MPLASFVDQYKTVIFDMDGVITSEQNYWNSSALTIYEFLHSDKLLGNSPIDIDFSMKHYKEIRDHIFFHDKIIKILKEKGVNSNWDLAYIVICLHIIMNESSSEKIYTYIGEKFHDNILDDYHFIAEETEKRTGKPSDRTSSLWQTISLIFQHWFLGDQAFYRKGYCSQSTAGKPGFLQQEEPIIDGNILKKIMKELFEKGIRIGIATGRPQDEMLAPLNSFNIAQYIDYHSKISYNYIKSAEDKIGNKISLSKPHPYIFLKSLLGENYSDFDIVSGKYDKNLPKTALLVGDAGSDILAAQSMGSDFLAVLTGVSGQKSRPYFEKLNSTYILDSLSDIYIPQNYQGGIFS